VQYLNDTVAKKSYVLLGRLNLPLHPKANLFSSLRRWYLFSALRVLLTEIHALSYRIQRTLQIREVELLRGKEKVRNWMDGCAVSGPCTHDYIAYMRQIEEENPFLSIFDRLLLSHAWKAGLESGVQRDTVRNQDNSRS
jgi:hypothetical protein